MDISELDDPEFLAERRGAREELAADPTSSELVIRVAAMDHEFDRHAGKAWGETAAS